MEKEDGDDGVDEGCGAQLTSQLVKDRVGLCSNWVGIGSVVLSLQRGQGLGGLCWSVQWWGGER